MRIDPDAPHARGVLFVKTKDEALFGPAGAQTRAAAAADHARFGNRVKKVHKDTGAERSELIEFNEDEVPIMEMIRRYHDLSWVEYAEPDYLVSLDAAVGDKVPNSPAGYNFRRIEAFKAWDIKHDTDQIVAVIDSGIWFRENNGSIDGHPDLIGTDPIRRRGNVFRGDLTGTNVINPAASSDPFDNSGAYMTVNPEKTGDLGNPVTYTGGHGTHVSGIIGALPNNDPTNSSVGIAWKCQILPFRIFDDFERTADQFDNDPQTAFTSDLATAINGAVSKEARIINMSLGSPFSETLSQAVKGDNGNNRNGEAVMVASAGNGGTCSDGPGPSPTPDPSASTDPVPTPTPALESGPGGLDSHNTDVHPHYPSGLPHPNLIAVASTNSDDRISCNPVSKIGPVSVDVAAPGTGIISTLNKKSAAAGDSYNKMSGTSMAAPHVSGTLALVRETYPQSTAWELLDRVRMSVDVLASLSGHAPGQLRDFQGKVSTAGRLNAYRALLPRSKMANVSSRTKVESGAGVVINGFILRADTRVVIRGIGPSLLGQGVSEPLGDPYLQLFDHNGVLIAENNNWRDSQAGEILATGVAPNNDLESAIVVNLPGPREGVLRSGAYTIHLTGAGGGQGVGLNEVYELSGIADPAQPPDPVTDAGGPEWRLNDLQRTQNLSSRAVVRGGDQITILGLIVEGKGVAGDFNATPPIPPTPPAARRVLIRALGRSLVAPNGLTESEVLPDPQLELLDGNGTVLAVNDNWKSADTSSTQIYQDKIKATGVNPTFDEEPVIIATLTPGAYTIKCSSADARQGIASVEAYEY